MLLIVSSGWCFILLNDGYLCLGRASIQRPKPPLCPPPRPSRFHSASTPAVQPLLPPAASTRAEMVRPPGTCHKLYQCNLHWQVEAYHLNSWWWSNRCVQHKGLFTHAYTDSQMCWTRFVENMWTFHKLYNTTVLPASLFTDITKQIYDMHKNVVFRRLDTKTTVWQNCRQMIRLLFLALWLYFNHLITVLTDAIFLRSKLLWSCIFLREE